MLRWRTVASLIAATLLAGVSLAATATVANAANAPAPLAGVFRQIKNTGTGLCLQPERNSTAIGAVIVQDVCTTVGTSGLAQGWQAVKTGTNHYKFINQLSGHCIDATVAADGADVLQWGCANISNQEFNIGTSLPAVAKIESRIGWKDSRFCLDVPGGLYVPGGRIQVWRCNGTPAQIFINGF